MVRLKVFDGLESVDEIELDDEVVSIGRDATSTLILPDHSVSRHHAQIEPRGNFHLVRDNGSTNGTFVNEMLVRLQVLTHGDVLRIGKYLIRVEARNKKSDDTTRVRVEKLSLPDEVEESTDLVGAAAEDVEMNRAEFNDQLATISEIQREIGHVDTAKALLERAIDLVLTEFDADRGSALMFAEPPSNGDEVGRPTPVVVRGIASDSEADLVIPQEVLDAACQSEGSVERTTPEVSRLACALRDKDRLKGLIYIERLAGQPAFSERDRLFLAALSSQIGVGLTNAELFAETTTGQEQIQAVFTSLTDGVVLTDSEFQIVEANVAATVLLRAEHKNVLGESFRSLLDRFEVTPPLPPNSKPAVGSLAVHSLASKRNDKSPDKAPPATAILSFKIVPFPRDADEPSGYVVTLRDRSEVWRIERLKSQFIENVAHKLRTPLTVIEANLPLLTERADDGEESHEEILAEIRRNSAILCRLVDRFVDFTEMGDLAAAQLQTSISLRKLLDDLIQAVADETQRKRVTLIDRMATDISQVAGYASRLTKAFANVIDNAMKFCKEGGKIILQARDENGFVRLEVIDDGPGIPPDELESIFLVGHQVDDEKTGQIPGAGLGLASVRQIIEEHGGEVWIASPYRPDKTGTCVTIRLPSAVRETTLEIAEGDTQSGVYHATDVVDVGAAQSAEGKESRT